MKPEERERGFLEAVAKRKDPNYKNKEDREDLEKLKKAEKKHKVLLKMRKENPKEFEKLQKEYEEYFTKPKPKKRRIKYKISGKPIYHRD
jgi:hypothetical protein